MILMLRLPIGRGSTGFGERSPPNASMRIDRDGSVIVSVPYLEMGGEICALIPPSIAAQLKVAASRVRVEQWLSDEKPLAHQISIADRSETIEASLRVLREVGAAARIMLTGAAAQRWDVSARSCVADEGEIIHTPTRRRFRYGELAADAAYRPVPREVEVREAAFG